ncbi:MAG: host-nuclease inhibitor protein Gam [Candidatus Nealsonbacteria bacterium]|nr:host-nuclease inhibitor protein Gam [Candidatus Nealsonbacteria bacterium]
MAKKRQIKHPVTPVPKSLEEATKFLRQIGEEQRATIAIQSTLNARVEELKAKAMSDAGPHQKRISELVEGLFAFAETNRNELTEGNKRKTVEVPTGTFGWRMTPPAVSLRDVKAVLENLKKLDLTRFIRIKEEVDKEAMLREPEVAEKVRGVSIGQYEEFIVKPTYLGVEITSRVDELKRAAS